MGQELTDRFGAATIVQWRSVPDETDVQLRYHGPGGITHLRSLLFPRFDAAGACLGTWLSVVAQAPASLTADRSTWVQEWHRSAQEIKLEIDEAGRVLSECPRLSALCQAECRGQTLSQIESMLASRFGAPAVRQMPRTAGADGHEDGDDESEWRYVNQEGSLTIHRWAWPRHNDRGRTAGRHVLMGVVADLPIDQREHRAAAEAALDAWAPGNDRIELVANQENEIVKLLFSRGEFPGREVLAQARSLAELTALAQQVFGPESDTVLESQPQFDVTTVRFAGPAKVEIRSLAMARYNRHGTVVERLILAAARSTATGHSRNTQPRSGNVE